VNSYFLLVAVLTCSVHSGDKLSHHFPGVHIVGFEWLCLRLSIRCLTWFVSVRRAWIVVRLSLLTVEFHLCTFCRLAARFAVWVIQLPSLGSTPLIQLHVHVDYHFSPRPHRKAYSAAPDKLNLSSGTKPLLQTHLCTFWARKLHLVVSFCYATSLGSGRWTGTITYYRTHLTLLGYEPTLISIFCIYRFLFVRIKLAAVFVRLSVDLVDFCGRNSRYFLL